MRLLVAVLVLVLAGCAKLPGGGGGAQGKRIVLTMVLDGELNENFVYIFPLRVSIDPNPPDDGPIPVIGPPWGNGFVAGNATHFVKYEPQRPQPFVLYKFLDSSLLNYIEIGTIEVYDTIPLDDPDVEQAERKRFRFEVEVNDLADTPIDADKLESAQINFLTMDRVGSGSDNRAWDALGDGSVELKSWITVPLRTAATYNNAQFNYIEPQSQDVADPALDIRDWTIEVRLP